MWPWANSADGNATKHKLQYIIISGFYGFQSVAVAHWTCRLYVYYTCLHFCDFLDDLHNCPCVYVCIYVCPSIHIHYASDINLLQLYRVPTVHSYMPRIHNEDNLIMQLLFWFQMYIWKWEKVITQVFIFKLI